MSYIGNTPEQQAFTPQVDYFNGNNSTTSFTLSRNVASVAQIEAVIENVVQNPTDAYTVNGNTITFTSAPPSGTNNIYVKYTSPITTVMVPTASSVNTNELANRSVTPAKMANSGYEYGMRNRIINGDMRIDQRNAGASVTPTTDAYTIDRWQVALTSSTTFFSLQQSSTAPTGFTKSLLATSLGANTPSAGQIYVLQQKIEGFNTADLSWGTANAQTVTLSFWVRASVTGTYGIIIGNGGLTRAYPATYTISSANTWEQKTITIPGDTTGTWTTDNTTGIRIHFNLGTGSTNSISSGSGWVTSAATAWSVSGTTNISATNGATFYITGVQLEIGSTATPFERRLYNQELANCQRYYYRTTPTSGSVFGFGWNANTTVSVVGGSFPVPMRDKPSALEQSGTASHYQILHGATATTCSSVPSFDTITSTTIYSTNFIVASGLTAGQGSGGRSNNASAYLGFSAEL